MAGTRNIAPVKLELLLIIAGMVYVIEALSVVLQVFRKDTVSAV